MTEDWDLVVIGLGAAGVCAAIEAAEAGLKVAALDRFEGGGATAISGGVVYAGGGTSVQVEAGVEDTPEAMFDYLKLETQGVVSDETLKRFCQTSPQMIEWLRARGVPFEASLCPSKTSYPSNDYYLYYSGNEAFAPYSEHATPAPRGHRAIGKGLPGANFFAPLNAAAQRAGVTFFHHTCAERLVTEGGRVVGVSGRQLTNRLHAYLHAQLERWAIRCNPYAPRWARRLRRWGAAWHRRFAQRLTLHAGSVLVTTGGFIYNRDRVKREAPSYRRGMPLGTIGCDGSGIALAEAVGAQTRHMDRISAWRFINPPLGFARGVLVDGSGRRFVNEALYGAALGEAIVECAEGRAHLILNERLVQQSKSQLGRGQTHWFQTAPALLNLWFGSTRHATAQGLADRLGLDATQLRQTLEDYSADAEDALGKPGAFRASLASGPYVAIDCSIDSRWFPLPTLTLGGLVVDEATGRVLGDDDEPIVGLYAAGRAALGICSRQYVSGLSIADCVFSGRRAAAAVTTARAPDASGREGSR